MKAGEEEGTNAFLDGLTSVPVDVPIPTEHTHHLAPKALIEGLAEKVTATNEPTHIECGAPDFVVTRNVTIMMVCLAAKQNWQT